MTMITPSYLGETIEYSSLHACRSTLEDPSQQEEYLRGKISANNYNNGGGDFWYYILPNGDFYEFTPPYSNRTLTGAFVAHLGVAVYNDPSLLWNAQNTAVPVGLTVSGNQLTIAPGAGYTGTFVGIATVSDGLATASRAFKVTINAASG